MINNDEWLIVGLITSCHGINGQVKVKSLSDFEERFIKPGLRWLQKENEPPSKIELISGFKNPGKETFILRFKGISTRNHAEKLKNCKILVKTNKLPKLNKEESPKIKYSPRFKPSSKLSEGPLITHALCVPQGHRADLSFPLAPEFR